MRSATGKQRPLDPRPCDTCAGSIFFAQRVAGVGKLVWRAFDAAPVTDDRRAFAHVLVGTQAWRRGDLLEHYLVSRQLADDKARELADTYPHHMLHTHPTDEGTDQS